MQENLSKKSNPQLPENMATQKLFAWANWKNTVMLVLSVFLLRLLYLLAINPWELAGDEAQYWDWARHPNWSYFTKGPGIAWTIFASVKLLGSYVWAVKLPATIALCIIMLTLARLGTRIADGDERVGFFAAVLTVLCPAYFGGSQFITIDEPYFACWALSALFAYHGFERLKENKSATRWWLLVAFFLGVGFLYKYTILLLIPGLFLFGLLRFKSLYLNKATNWLQLLPAAIMFLIIISPVFIWNSQHDWITVRHLLGHVKLSGGDRVVTSADAWKFSNLLYIPEMIFTQIGIIGIPICILIFISLFNQKKLSVQNPNRWFGVMYLVWCALPVLTFYLCVAFLKKVQPNWPLAGFLTLIPLAAIPGPIELGKYKLMLSDWLNKGKKGKKPKTQWQANWHFAIGWGSVGIVLISIVPFAQHLPSFDITIPFYKTVHIPHGRDYPGIGRVSGFRQEALAIDQVLINEHQILGPKPLIITNNYQTTARLAFYLPEKPTVSTAQWYMGSRTTDYDRFENTRLDNESFLGRNALLVGGSLEQWQKTLKFANIQPVEKQSMPTEHKLFVATNYQGPVKLMTH